MARIQTDQDMKEEELQWKGLELATTERGFAIARFEDRYQKKCSIQKSSIAFEDCIWLGVDDPKPEILKEGGWVAYKIPKEVSIKTRMHLTQDNVRALLPLLIEFARNGDL